MQQWSVRHIEGRWRAEAACLIPSNSLDGPTEAYIRTSVGLDYASAAPVRGIRRGRAAEHLDVKVSVMKTAGRQ